MPISMNIYEQGHLHIYITMIDVDCKLNIHVIDVDCMLNIHVIAVDSILNIHVIDVDSILNMIHIYLKIAYLSFYVVEDQ